jgi:hypothetical protein
MKERTAGRSSPSFDVCDCIEWFDDLDELTEDDFEDEPCPTCGGRVVIGRPPAWMVEEEDDC